MASAELDFADRDERLGEAVEEYLALAESGSAPDVEEFAGRYPDLSGDLREALEGLSLVRGLVGQPAISTGPKLEAGRRLAGYRIVGELGSGGMGVVYEAVHVDLDRPVALKVLDARATRDGNGLRRFLNEAKTAAALHHTHIVPVFDVGHVGGLCYYAMQRIEGCGLDRLVKSLRRERTSGAGSGSGRRSWTWKRSHLIRANPDTEPDLSGLVSGATLSWAAEKRRWHRDAVELNSQQAPFEPPRGSAYYRWVAEIGRQAAQALAYAHRRGVIHRDIKPSNLLVDVRGVVWVADFGLARRLTDPGLTHSDSVIGTPRYMSPEQTRSGPVDGRSDVYSLGATLYELLTLRPPFEGRTTAELFEQISRDEPIQPRRLDPFVPRDLETIVLKALSKRPGDRYSDPTELAEDLERFLNLEPVRARRIGPLGRAWRFAQRHPALTGVTLGAATVILAVTTIAYDRVVHERDRAIQAELKYKDAHREGLLNEAILLRNSWETDRREKGFAKLAEAARLDPDPDEQTKLQTEAIAFLSLRDVEQRKTLKIDRSTGLAFNSDGTRLATVSADRTMVTFWSVESGRQLGQPQPAGPSNGTLREQDGPWNLGLRGSSRIAAAGPCVVTIWPDGRGLRLLNFATGLSTADIRCLNREIYAVYAASTTDGLRIVTIDRTRGDGRRVCLWDPDRPEEPIATLAESRPGPTEPRQFPLIAVARGGDTIATAWSRGTTVALYSLQDGHMLGEELDTNMAVSALAMDAFNHLAVAGGGAVRLWDLTAPVPTSLPSITPHKNYIGAMRFSPDGSLLAVAGSGRDVELWDPAANTLVAALPTAEWVTDLSFAPAGSSFAVGQPAGVALWAIVDSPIVARASGFQASPTALAFGPDGRLAMAFRPAPTNEDVRLWQPEHCPTTARSLPGSGPALVAFDSEGHLNLFRGDRFDQFTIDGPSFNTSTPDRSLVLPEFLPHSWDRNRDRDHNHDRGAGNRPPPPRERSSPFSFQVPALGQTPDGRIIALSRWSQGANHLILWRPSDPDRLQTIIPPGDQRRIGQAPWTQIALAPNATRLYLASIGPGPAGNPSGEFQVWSIVGDTATRLRWPYRYGRITALALSPDGTTLALGDRSGDLLLIDSATGSLQTRLAPPHDGQPGVLTALAFSPRGDALAVGTKLGSVLVYHLKPGQPEPKAPLRLTDHRGQVLALAYDRTGTRLATSGQDNTVTVWSLDRLDRELARLGLAW